MIRVDSRTKYTDKLIKNTLHVDDILNFMTINITPNHVDTEEVHDFWEMVYLESGEAIATADDKKILLFPGEIIFHKPGEIHAFRSANNTTAKAFFISFHSTCSDTKLFESLKVELEPEQKKMVYKLYDEARNIYLYNKKIYHSVIFSSSSLSPNIPTGAQQLFRNHMEEFLISIIQLMERKETSVSSKTREELEHQIYQKMVERITDAVYSHISVEDLCTEFNYGKTYLSALFKKHSGQSILSYYNALKIEEAKKLIRKGNDSLAQISSKLHFSNQYYFSKVFKRIEGKSPSEYKAQL